jgi:hypothetical protein
MLAVAVQLPAAVVAVESSGVAGRALTSAELELEPEASAGVASVRTAPAAHTTDLMLMSKPPLHPSMNETRVGGKRLQLAYETLKSSERRHARHSARLVTRVRLQ